MFLVAVEKKFALRHFSTAKSCILGVLGMFVYSCKSMLKNFLSICNNMTVKQHINHGVIQKVCHLRNSIFHSSNLSHTFFSQVYSITSLMLFTKNKQWNERKEYLLYICLLQRSTLYQRR